MKTYRITIEVLVEVEDSIELDPEGEMALINKDQDAFYPLLGFEVDRCNKGPYAKAEGALSDIELENIGIICIDYIRTEIEEVELKEVEVRNTGETSKETDKEVTLLKVKEYPVISIEMV